MTKQQIIELLRRLPSDWEGLLIPLSDGTQGKVYLQTVKCEVFKAHEHLPLTREERAKVIGTSIRTITEHWPTNLSFHLGDKVDSRDPETFRGG